MFVAAKHCTNSDERQKDNRGFYFEFVQFIFTGRQKNERKKNDGHERRDVEDLTDHLSV
jgi:hypothetical protein